MRQIKDSMIWFPVLNGHRTALHAARPLAAFFAALI
jgi:hypothetical protein